jgi:hypothetical protein
MIAAPCRINKGTALYRLVVVMNRDANMYCALQVAQDALDCCAVASLGVSNVAAKKRNISRNTTACTTLKCQEETANKTALRNIKLRQDQ